MPHPPLDLALAIIRNPIIVHPDMTVMASIAQMSEARSKCATTKSASSQLEQLHIEVRASCVLVIENDRLLGIMTERDVVHLSAQQQRLDCLTMREVMVRDVLTLKESAFTDLFLAINLLKTNHIRHLPIMDDRDRLIGLVTHESLRQISRPLDLLKLRLVKEVMTREVVCAEPNASMLAIAQMMSTHAVSSVMIVESQEKIAGAYQIAVGILTERDIVQFQALGLNLTSWIASTLMSSPIFTVTPDDSLLLVHQLMEQRFIGRLAVVGEQGELLGIVTQTSLLQALNPLELYSLAEYLEKKVARLEEEKLALLTTRNIELEQKQVVTYQQLQDELIKRQKAELALQELNQSLERKVADRSNELRSSEAQNRAMIEAIPDLLLRVTRDGKCLEYINSHDREKKFLPIKNHLSEILSPDLLQKQLEAIDRAIVTGELQVYEHQLYKRDRLVFEEVRIIPINDNEALIIVRDETDRKQAEIALQKSETRFRRIFESSIVGMMFTNFQGEITNANDRFLDMLGYTREDLLAKSINWSDITPLEYLAADLHAIQHLKLSREIEPWEKIYYHKNGHPIHVLIGVAMLNDDECVCVVVDISDRKEVELRLQQQAEQEKLLGRITQRMRSTLQLNEVLKTTVEEVRQGLNADRVLVYRVFPDGSGSAIAESVLPQWPNILNIVFPEDIFPDFNDDRDSPQHGEPNSEPAIQERVFILSDRNNEAALLTPTLERFLTEIQVIARLGVPIIQNGTIWGLLVAHQCDRPRQWEKEEINLLQKIANQLVIAIQQASLFEQLQQELSVRQLAEQKLTERNQQLAISNEELARATHLKDEFLANMSHELRTPLNAILGMTEGLQDGVFGEIHEPQVKALQTIERSGSHLLELINDVLDVAKIESGQIELEYSQISIKSLCQSSLTFVKQQALKKRIQIETKFHHHLPNLMADERRIRQVLINLLNNAVKFTPENGHITLAVNCLQLPESNPESNPEANLIAEELHITKDEKSDKKNSEIGQYIRISIIDTGIGIAPENMQKLFQPFIQIDSALNRQYQGTGLGLALVKSIVEMHGGMVGLTSEVGVGSCFTIDLPYQEPSHSETVESVVAIGSPSSQIGEEPSPLILIVEDNEANIMTISSYLSAKGYHILLAKNEQEAIALARSADPDLILIAIQMPAIDGLEIISEIRQIPNLEAIPIIAMTENAMPETVMNENVMNENAMNESGNNLGNKLGNSLGIESDRDLTRDLTKEPNEYLSKPVKLRELATTIHRLLTTKS
ncbi:CBS domain-containing protein [Pseudanabaena sp. 'Roaring Creek']|uniref:CBS domain-containing protein n=1 Tax=Pseudanabaena sp. 'Roaring Creek' TaxID=1681830 RepID=UPI001E38CCE8|nr:CBS domain-containing protein [Pseudanabaena sp. 'Roaring Creek']